MLIREAGPEDAGALAEVFFRAIREGAVCYTPDQRAAWAAKQPSAQVWGKRLDGLVTMMAEDVQGIAGFMSMRMKDGYLDLAFVAPERIGSGTGTQLYAVMENRARAAGLARLHSHASEMLMPLLVARGWSKMSRNRVERGGVTLDNWIMEKHLK